MSERMHVVINPTWRCQLRCDYCWLPHVKIDREAGEHEWHEWAAALVAHLPAGSVVDVAGGEPLLYAGLPELLAALGNAGHAWAISTNAIATDAIDRLIAMHPPGCAVINVSDHRGNVAAHDNVTLLRQHFPLRVHRVAHPSAGTHEGGAGLIPYQRWAEGAGVDGVTRRCDAGARHWVADPAGKLFRCCVDMQMGNEPFGNLFAGARLPEPFRCEFGCSSCYTTDFPAWLIRAEVAPCTS